MGPIIPGTWVPTFHDHFDSGLNPAMWAKQDNIARGNCLLKSSQVSIVNSSLRLTAVNGQSGPASGFWGAEVTTEKRYGFQYGWVECSARCTSGKGFLPAVWLLNIHHWDGGSTWRSFAEIDVMEARGFLPGTITHNLHWGTYPQHSSWGTQAYAPAGVDFTAGYHSFACNWQPGLVDYYVDGAHTFSYPVAANVPAIPANLVISLQVGGPYATEPDTTTLWPGIFEVDWIGVWQDTGWRGIYTVDASALSLSTTQLSTLQATLLSLGSDSAHRTQVTAIDPGKPDKLSLTVSAHSPMSINDFANILEIPLQIPAATLVDRLRIAVQATT